MEMVKITMKSTRSKFFLKKKQTKIRTNLTFYAFLLLISLFLHFYTLYYFKIKFKLVKYLGKHLSNYFQNVKIIILLKNVAYYIKGIVF